MKASSPWPQTTASYMPVASCRSGRTLANQPPMTFFSPGWRACTFCVHW
jgi:hypothetical protein